LVKKTLNLTVIIIIFDDKSGPGTESLLKILTKTLPTLVERRS